MPTDSGPVPEEPKGGQESNAQAESRETRRYRRSAGEFFPRAIWGVSIIAIGLILLAQSLGLFGFMDVGLFFSRIWPVFIILLGLSIISRGGWVAGIFSLIVALAVIALVLAYALGAPFAGRFGNSGWFGTGWREDRVTVRDMEIDVARETAAKSAEIFLNASAGRIIVSGGTGKLAEGSLRSTVADLETKNRLEGDIQKVELRTRNNFSFRGFGMENTLDLRLSDSVPLRLVMDSGAADLDVDLSGLQVREFVADAGASSLNLVLGAGLDQSDIRIDAGASSINIILPKEVGARVNIDSGLSSKSLPGFKQTDGKNFQSENYDQAAKKADIQIRGGASSIDIRWK